MVWPLLPTLPASSLLVPPYVLDICADICVSAYVLAILNSEMGHSPVSSLCPECPSPPFQMAQFPYSNLTHMGTHTQNLYEIIREMLLLSTLPSP